MIVIGTFGEIILSLLGITTYISIGIFFVFTFFIILPVLFVKIFNKSTDSIKSIFKNDKGKFNILWIFYFIGLTALLIPVIFNNGLVMDFYNTYIFSFTGS